MSSYHDIYVGSCLDIYLIFSTGMIKPSYFKEHQNMFLYHTHHFPDIRAFYRDILRESKHNSWGCWVAYLALGDTGLCEYFKIVPKFYYLCNRLIVSVREQHFRSVEVYTTEDAGILQGLLGWWWVWFYLTGLLSQKMFQKLKVWVPRKHHHFSLYNIMQLFYK